jgi:succinoglycan biosynthesis transport protein ExoP
MELQDYLHIILKYLKVSLLGAVIAAILGLALNWYLDFIPLYSATSAVMIGGDVATVASDPTDYKTLAAQFTETYADLATRYPILQGVIDTLGLQTTPKSLKSYVSSTVVQGTQVIEITASNDNPKIAAAIANEDARQLILFSPKIVRNFVLTVDTAPVPIIPSLSFLLIPMVAAVLGFLLVGGSAFLLEFLRNPIYSAEELNRRTNVPVLATIRSRPKPNGREQRRREKKFPSWRKVNDAPWWPLVQTCQRRFEELGLPSNPHPKKPLVLVTSPVNSRDKSIVAANLATAWTKTGAKVVLVDADLNSSTLTKWFKQSKQSGLADLIEQPDLCEDIDKALQPTGINGLMLLPSGKGTSNSADGLNTQSFGKVLDMLSQKSDAIIVSGPAMLTGSEAGMMATQAHGVILALRSGVTTLDATADARDALVMAKGNLWGSILLDGVKVK